MFFIGDRIRAYRKKNKISKAEFSRITGLSVYKITQFEDRWAAPDGMQMRKILKAMGELPEPKDEEASDENF